jgi:DNA-binding NarL/FixJ family response regulator
MDNRPAIQVAIIEDDAKLSEQMQRMLSAPEHRIEVCFVVDTVSDFLRKQEEGAWLLDVILLDLDLNGKMSIPYIQAIKQVNPQAKVVAVTGYEDEDILSYAIEQGADGYFVKRQNSKPSLVEIIQLTHKGGAYIEPMLSSKLLKTFQDRHRALRFDVDRLAKAFNVDLSKREIEVLEGLMEERSYQEIADLHFISINTVRYYVKLLYQKLGVNSKRALIQKVRGLE